MPHLNDEQQNKNKMASICVGLFLLLATRVDLSLCGDTSIQTSPNGFGFSAETEILVSIILLVILYLLSKFLLAHHEPNVCVYGNLYYFWREAKILSKCFKKMKEMSSMLIISELWKTILSSQYGLRLFLKRAISKTYIF